MLYRLATVGIVAFWLVMMGLLVRLETHPEQTNIMDVPVSYVMRIMFKHGQQSILAATQDEKPVGTVALRPLMTGSDTRTLDFSGTLALELPTGTRDRVNFNTSLDIDKALSVEGFHLELSMQQSHYRLSAWGDRAHNSLTYEVHQGTRRLASQSLPMDSAALVPALLRSVGLEPAMAPISTGGIETPTVTARETQITMHGEQLEVYQLTVHQGATTAADIYVTQLGQIVLATTDFGYKFSAEEYQ